MEENRTDTAEGTSRKDPDQGFDSLQALRRLTYLGAGGCVLILIFAYSARSTFFAAASVGLMTACAASMAGVLIGFLFGVPFTKDEAAVSGKSDQKASTVEGSSDSGETTQSSLYKPNTSLEQVSDWLTKMIVGVGLVELKSLPHLLSKTAKYIASGLPGGTGAEPLAVALIVYFSVCGFLFGFLWARIYLQRWFSEAERNLDRRIDNKLSKIESKLVADSNAWARVNQQLNRQPEEEMLSDSQMNEVIQKASSTIKPQIFELARSASEDGKHPHHQTRIQTAIAIFRALIASDKGASFHRNHAELSYALSRKKPAEITEAVEAIDEAIRRRDKNEVGGWKSYELRRARYHIQLDEQFKLGSKSSPENAEIILRDLRIARKSADNEKWNRWLSEQRYVKEWIDLNEPVL